MLMLKDRLDFDRLPWKQHRQKEQDQKYLDPPTQVPRSRTDCVGAVFALLVVALLVAAAVYAGRFRNERLYDRKGSLFPQHLPDFSGGLCGEAEHAEEPFIFFCTEQDTLNATLDYEHPVCRSSCPTTGPNGTAATTNHSCPTGRNGTLGSSPVRDYASTPVAGVLCLPDDRGLVQERLFEVIEGLALGATSRTWVLEVSILMRAWKLVVMSALLSLVLGVVYLQLLRRCARAVVTICLVLAVAGPAMLGTAFVYSSQWEEGFCPSSADHCLTSGLALVLVGVLAACLAVGLDGDLLSAVECLESALYCVRGAPALLWEPLVAAAVRAAVLCLLLPLLVSLLSCGRIHVDPATDRVSFTHGLPNLLLLGFVASSLAWLLELSSALSEFVTSFVVQTRFFSPTVGRSDILMARAYIRCFQYHLGTLAWGSIVIPLARIPRMAAARLEPANQREVIENERDARGIHQLHKRLYMDTVSSGHSFYEASATAAAVMRYGTPAGLEGVMLVCKIAGVGAITSAGFALTYTCSRALQTYSVPGGAEYVQDPMFLATASAVVSFVLALPFAEFFGRVVDTLLYCITIGDSPSGDTAQLEASLQRALDLRKGARDF
jgi:hypothetical protein